jgi:hypothetical protein
MNLAAMRLLRGKVEDHEKTEQLKQRLAVLRRRRQPFYLTRADLQRILRWKLRSQYGRSAKFREHLTDALVRHVTQATFGYRANNCDIELGVRIRLLAALPGVGVPVASAVLALVEPHRYCVVDYRGWRTLFGEERRHFSVRDYRRYRTAIAKLADRLGWPVQETDAVVWEFDRRRRTVVRKQGIIR